MKCDQFNCADSVDTICSSGKASEIPITPTESFFEKTATVEGWATCPLTENAFLRILGGGGYHGGLGSPMAVRPLLDALRSAPGHQFWPDDVSLMDARIFPTLPASKHLTDLYLLGLAVKHGGRFAAFDQNIDASLIPGGPQAFYLIPSE